jgi:hypothetical protein
MIDPAKLKPITFDPVNNVYIGLGKVVGNAFGSGKQLKVIGQVNDLFVEEP